MPIFAPSRTLTRVSTAKANELDRWVEGVWLESNTGRSIDELKLRAIEDRWRLADDFRRRGQRLVRPPTPSYRDALSRFYYSMYHATRAVVFLAEGGDDHDGHLTLPTRLPGDFPQDDQWKIRLKDARLARNRADYEPYPKSDAAWRGDAIALEALARQYLPLAKTYCVTHGCTGL